MNIFERFFAWLRSLFGGGGTVLAPGWSILYSHNVPPQMSANPDGTYYFDFPQQDGVHYVVEPSGPIAPGRTITMRFSIVGNGKLIPKDGDATARVRIMVQKRGDNPSLNTADARWWSQPIELTAPGDYTLTAVLDFDKWSTIGGGLPTQGEAGFKSCLADLGTIGFTFGGWSAGHGVYAQGPSRFILKSFTIN